MYGLLDAWSAQHMLSLPLHVYPRGEHRWREDKASLTAQLCCLKAESRGLQGLRSFRHSSAQRPVCEPNHMPALASLSLTLLALRAARQVHASMHTPDPPWCMHHTLASMQEAPPGQPSS